MGQEAIPSRRVLLPLIAALVAAGALGWGVGFVWFLHVTAQPAAPPPAHADGVVALTGGAGRVELALRLLATGQADRLLVSGIGGNADLSALAHHAKVDVSMLEASITLGRYAASTQGNAVETAAWATQNRIRALIVVTAAWHMPRAIAELRQALPAVRLFPYPVEPPEYVEHITAERGPSLRLRAEEYTKYLLVIAGISSWLPHREAALSSTATLGRSG